MSLLSGNEKRKYAMALRRIEYGIWGYPLSLFRVITLTTKEGDEQTVKRFGRDVAKLIKWFRKLGYEVNYCGCYELTPKKGLLHWHGILRVKGGYFPITRRELGDKWDELHGAFAVTIEPVKSPKYLTKYITKHMVKDYLAGDLIRNKFLVSHTWVRKGCKGVISEFKAWWINGSGDIWLSTKAWSILNKIIRGWCEHTKIIVTPSFGHFMVDSGVVSAVIYEYNEKGERI